MGLIKSPPFPRYGGHHRMNESVQHALSWMTRPRPGIKWRMPARSETNRPNPGPASFQPHHSS
jgi:hypothetical protein